MCCYSIVVSFGGAFNSTLFIITIWWTPINFPNIDSFESREKNKMYWNECKWTFARVYRKSIEWNIFWSISSIWHSNQFEKYSKILYIWTHSLHELYQNSQLQHWAHLYLTLGQNWNSFCNSLCMHNFSKLHSIWFFHPSIRLVQLFAFWAQPNQKNGSYKNFWNFPKFFSK